MIGRCTRTGWLGLAFVSTVASCTSASPVSQLQDGFDAGFTDVDAGVTDAAEPGGRDASTVTRDSLDPDGESARADRTVHDAAVVAPDAMISIDELKGGVLLAPVEEPGAQEQAFQELRRQAEVAESLSAEELLARHQAGLQTELSYNPAESAHLDRIQASALALSDDEMEVLGQQGLVISTRREFPTFLRGLAEIYSEHLPLYISADALLETVHSSYDSILLVIERAFMVSDLQVLLHGMRARLGEAEASETTKAHTDTYLAVALSLLEDLAVEPVAGGDAEAIGKLYGLAKDATQGVAAISLFGSDRLADFTQFKPRGHYVRDSLENYFRAMMWLGRMDLRLIETLSSGEQVLRPEQYRAMLLISDLVGPDRDRWERIDRALRTFVGESDCMVLPDVAALVNDLGGRQSAVASDDEEILDAIARGDYGAQQIASHLMSSRGARTPLNRSFLLFGQRYIVDSHVFSEVTYDRVRRLMPRALDAAFAALGNDQSLAFLGSELEAADGYAGGLARMRLLIGSHDDSFWDSSFYNLWLRALRALSPSNLEGVVGLPEIVKTEAFGRRILNTQLGSWSQLRHDTLLYAKQSYTGIPICDFPDVYVDPYPGFYAALVRYADQGKRIVAVAQEVDDEYLAPRLETYFDALKSTSQTLKEMAEHQLRGEPFTEAQMAFVNQAVRIEPGSFGCGSAPEADGWYAELFFAPERSLEFDPTIADVHTQPADWNGAIVGKVLHVGTGFPRMLVVTADTCEGPKAYVGVAYAYHEKITTDFRRLNDQEWRRQFGEGRAPGVVERPEEVPWLKPVLAP